MEKSGNFFSSKLNINITACLSDNDQTKKPYNNAMKWSYNFNTFNDVCNSKSYTEFCSSYRFFKLTFQKDSKANSLLKGGVKCEDYKRNALSQNKCLI